MTNAPSMSHNAITEQALHLARLRIAERCKVDLYYLCRYVLGYEAMTEATHGELCEVTRSLIPGLRGHTSGRLQEPTDIERDAQYILYDVAGSEQTPKTTPHSTPEDTLAGSTYYLNSPSSVPTENSDSLSDTPPQNTPEKSEQNNYSVSENTGLYQSVEVKQSEFSGNESDVPYDPMQGNEYTELPYDPDKKALHIEMPRGTFKSSVVTIGFAIQSILNDPNWRVLIDSETYSKSKNFLAEVKGHFEKNKLLREVYHTLYGVMPDEYKKNTSVRWKDNELDLSCRTRETKEASFTVSGIDKSINGMHYDLIIADDLHSETNVTNREQIDKVIQHYKLLLSLLDPGRYLIVIGTRWHYNDMYQYLFDFESFRFNFYIRKAVNQDGSLLFPERLTRQFLADQRKSQGSYLYSCQYMNTPVDDEDATFKRSYIITRKWELVEPIPINWYMSVDPSWEGKSSDFAAITIAGLDGMSNLYVRHVLRHKMRYDELIDQIFILYLRYKPKEIAIETIASANSIQYMLSQEMKRRGIILPIKYIAGRNTNKEIRIEALQPYYAYGRAIHVAECPQREDLEDELIAFPKGANDDAIDSLATILEIAKPAKQTKDPEEREKMKAKIDKFTKPRSPLTRV